MEKIEPEISPLTSLLIYNKARLGRRLNTCTIVFHSHHDNTICTHNVTTPQCLLFHPPPPPPAPQLEVEVETVKARLEALRRAKSTTIIRREREREEVHVSAERLARLPRCSAAPTGHTPHQQASPVGSLAPGETTPTGTPCRHGNLKEENEQLKLQVVILIHVHCHVYNYVLHDMCMYSTYSM